METYSLEHAIRSFFNSDVSPNREECDNLARSLLGGQSIVPFDIQGQFSYTVYSLQAAGTQVRRPGRDDDSNSQAAANNAKIVQFRLPTSRIDVPMAQLAKAIHGDIAAETDYYGELGHKGRASLGVYLIQKLPGVPYIELGNFSNAMNSDMASNQLTLVQDFARFFAADWLNPQSVTQHQLQKTRATISRKLALLTSTLPPRFTAIASRAQKELDKIFHDGYPQVLTHGDLSPMNILVSPTTGRVTGIIDWAEAGVLPFGLALYGLENLLGYMGPGEWNYFNIRDKLELRFWTQFWNYITDVPTPPEESTWHTVTIARKVGVLLQYGFKWENGTVETAVTEKDTGSLAYLDAFLLDGEGRSANKGIINLISEAPNWMFQTSGRS